ncbi:unnamed protein product [Mytilus edulis]|uniref:Uncharacterized protein n=1 Tax=Mytilus edulis TaxID=6550 RepID=A0A8S3UP45_MYTED|nr:unnamed protein product [Mytilus edulis]
MLMLQNGTPIECAALKGKYDIFRYLLTLEYDQETRSKKGEIALLNAARNGHLKITKWLIEEEGISPYIMSIKGKTPFDLAAEKSFFDIGKRRVMIYLKSLMKDKDLRNLTEVLTGPADEIQIFSDKEFKDLLNSGSYKCYWNRIFLTGPFGVGKTALAKILVGEDVPEQRESTDGIWIYIGRAGMDIQERRWIFLKKGISY